MTISTCCSLPKQLDATLPTPKSSLTHGQHRLPELRDANITSGHRGCHGYIHGSTLPNHCLLYSLPEKIGKIALSYLEQHELRILNRACLAHMTPFWDHTRLDAPTKIPLAALPEYYYTRTTDDAESIERVFNRIIPRLDFLLHPDNDFFGEHMRSVIDVAQDEDPLWTFTPTASGRTMVGKHPELSGYVFKFYMKPSGAADHFQNIPASDEVNPMAHTLRVPMALWMRRTIREQGLTQLDVPHKALIPLFPEEIISTLNEKSINHAFVVMAEDQSPFRCADLSLRRLDPDTQRKTIEQICGLLYRAPLIDCKWENWIYGTKKQFMIIDTEPLLGEVLPETTSSSFSTCRKIGLLPRRTLQECFVTALHRLYTSQGTSSLPIAQEAIQEEISMHTI